MHHLPTSAHGIFFHSNHPMGIPHHQKNKKTTQQTIFGGGFPRHPKNPKSRNHKGKSGPDKDGSWIGPLMPEAATHSTGGPYVDSIRRDHQQIMTGLEKLNMMCIIYVNSEYHWSLPSSKCDTLLGINNFPSQPALLKMILLFQWWDMLVSWRVDLRFLWSL